LKSQFFIVKPKHLLYLKKNPSIKEVSLPMQGSEIIEKTEYSIFLVKEFFGNLLITPFGSLEKKKVSKKYFFLLFFAKKDCYPKAAIP